MEIGTYLPSRQFAVLAGAIVLSALIILGAEAVGEAHGGGARAIIGGNTLAPASEGDPAAQLQAIIGSAPQHAADASSGSADALLSAARTQNVTDNIGRAIVVQAGAAQGRGTITDQATQSEIVQEALAGIPSALNLPNAFSQSQIPALSDTQTSEHAYGNALSTTLAAHAGASYRAALLPVTLSVDAGADKGLDQLTKVSAQYTALSGDLIRLPAPAPFIPFELAIANNYARMAIAATEMRFALSDPARGLAGVEAFSTLYNRNQDQFTQFALALRNNGILFKSDEPGVAWPAFLAAVQNSQPAQ